MSEAADRKQEIKRRRHRRKKYKQFSDKLQKANTSERAIIAEKVRNQTTWLTAGPAALSVPTTTYWRILLREAGFQIRQEKSLGGLIRCFNAAKRTASQIQQLAFNLDLGE